VLLFKRYFEEISSTWLEVNTTPEPTNCMTGKGFERSMMYV
jgi:hypothetical protein